MRPNAAATPAATTPDPYSRPKAIIVAAAAFEDEVVTALPEGDEGGAPVAEEVELEVDEGAAVKFVLSRVPQSFARFAVQTFWAAALFSPATIQFW